MLLAAPVCLMGPTAVGKSQLALALAERLPCDLISVDSTMVYRGMDIGTAKPEPAILAQIPHRLIDIRDPSEGYSAGAFLRDARREIEHSLKRQRVPLLVGGTMLYFRVLTQGIAELPGSDIGLRVQFEQQLQTEGLDALYERLARVDPTAAARIHPHDAQRIQRALAVHAQSGQPMTQLLARHTSKNPPWRIIQLALLPSDRAQLGAVIEARFRNMLKRGLIEEVRQLYQRGDLHAGLPALKAVGYAQIWAWLAGQIDEQTMSARAMAATRQLAKRQLSWLRHWPALHCFQAESPHLAGEVTDFLRRKLAG